MKTFAKQIGVILILLLGFNSCLKSKEQNLITIKDYENFEFLSPVNPWDVQDQFKADFDKLKTLEVTLNKGQIIFIPAYWWYSIWFQENTSIVSFKYKTAL